MERFYKLFMIPALIIVVIGLMAGFGSPSEEEQAQSLIKERTSVLQGVYFGKLDDEAAISCLSKIETYPLYNQDVYNIKNMKAQGFDMVRATKISDVSQHTKMYSYLSYTMNIKWTMRGFEGDYNTMGRYSVTIKNTDNKYKLSEFTLMK